MQKNSIEVNGFRLNYIIEGEGIPAIVIGSSLFYQRVFPRQIGKRLQLIYLDHRGFVKPPNRKIENEEFNIDHLLEDIETLRRFLQLGKVLIIGHSGHAFLALEYAKKYNDKVLGTVIMGVSPGYSEKMHSQTEAFFEKTASKKRKKEYNNAMQQLPMLIQKNPEKRFVSFCLCSGAKNWYQYNFNASLLWKNVYINMQMIDYVWGVIFRDINIKSNLNNLSTPVFLMLGKYDYVTGPPGLWDDIQEEFRDLQIKVFRKSGHYPMFEEPENFTVELIKWIDKKINYQFQNENIT